MKFQGVVLTHRNLVACMKCIMFMLNPKPDECYIAYLPLAHVLELLSENTMMLLGIKVRAPSYVNTLKWIYLWLKLEILLFFAIFSWRWDILRLIQWRICPPKSERATKEMPAYSNLQWCVLYRSSWTGKVNYKSYDFQRKIN